jgi:5-methylcytosine-specific restriction endonuclease McrA
VGKQTLDNGQTLCSVCNFRKKTLAQTESGKKMFIRMWKVAKQIKDVKYTKLL